MRRFEEFHPASLLLFFLVIIFSSMFLMELKLVIATWLAGTIYIQFLEKKISIKIYFYTVLAVIVMAIANMLVSHNGTHILFYINNKAITIEAGIYGGKTGFMLMAAGIWFLSMSRVITTEKWQCIFRRMPKLALLFSTILNLVPRYLQKFKKVQTYQKINGNYKDNKNGILKITSGVFTWGLENGVKTANIMEMKGFTSAKKIFSPFSFKTRDFCLILFTGVCCALFVIFENYRYIIAFVFGIFPLIFTWKESVKFWIFSLKK